MLVDGRWRTGRLGDGLAVQDPATGRTLTTVADADERDALDALAAADRAREAWACQARP